MSRPGPGVPKLPPPPNDYTHQAPKTQPKPAEPFISANEAIKVAQEEARKAVAEAARQVGTPRSQPHPFETTAVSEPPRVVITDESEKGPDQAKKPTSWVPDQKVAYGGIGGAVTILLVTVLKSYGVEIDPVGAGAIATLVTFLVQYLIPGGGS